MPYVRRKWLLATVIALLLLCGVTSLSAEQSSTRILFDFRTDSHPGPVKRGSLIPLKTQREILSTLFPKYLNNEDACKPENAQQPSDNATLQAQRENGQIVPSIDTFLDGSFTAPRTRQTAYFIKVGECFASTSSYWGTYRLAIFEGSRLVANVSPQVGTHGDWQANGIATAADVNNDGMDELLLVAIAFGMGEVEEKAGLVSLRSGKLETIRGFDSVYDNPCASQNPDRVTASVIAYSSTHLFVDEYEAPCHGDAAKGKVPSLADFKPVPQSHQ